MSDIEEFKINVTQMTNNKLCEIIVSNRYLGLFRDEAIFCMQELAARRADGDNFDYEKHIETLLESLPKINLDLKKIMNMPRII